MILYCENAYIDGEIKPYHSIEIENGTINRVSPFEPAKASVMVEGIVVPGFIDIQVNGGGGVLLNQQRSAESVLKMFEAHQQYGTTSMLPTLITDTADVMVEAAAAIRDARKLCETGILGVHFEGPWLSEERKGVHKSEFIRAPSDSELAILSDPLLGKVLVTLAPESVEPGVIRDMVGAGIIVFLGHSDAPADVVERAIEAGATGFTHLYNAMSPLTSRAPGMVGTALASHSYAGIIVDGFHASPTACNVAFRAKGPKEMILVTDAMSFAGSNAQEIAFFDSTILLADKKLTTPDGTLAGSSLTMEDAVKNTVALCGQRIADAIEMATQTPAKALGVDHLVGSIAPGRVANLLSLDNQLSVKRLWQNGREIPVFGEH